MKFRIISNNISHPAGNTWPSTRKPAALLFSLLSVALLCAPGVRADVVSPFNTDAEGWSVVSFGDLPSSNFSVVGTYPVTYNATGGNPGGYVSSGDPDGGDFTFSAPAKFLGVDTTATGLTYDLTHPTGAINYQATDVILLGANGEYLLWKSNPDLVPGVGWISVSLAFTPSSNWHVGTSNGALATAADFQSVLGNLSGLYIRGEYTAGDETAGVDNVRLAGVVPEPGSCALLLVAAVSGLAVRLRSSRSSQR